MSGINQWSIVTTKHCDVYKHSCTACKSTTLVMGKDQPVRGFCCGVWVTPPKETFFTTKLPREKYTPPRSFKPLTGKHVEDEEDVLA